MTARTRITFLVLAALTAVLTVTLAGPAEAVVSVSRAEISGTQLRIEGRAAASRPITVDGVQMTTSSSDGSFRIERSGYTRPADCTVDVNDGSAAAVNVRLSGCTVTAPATATLSGFAVSPSAVQGGATTTVTATVTLSAAAPSGGAPVSFTSDNPVVTVRTSATVPAGATSVAVPQFATTTEVAANTAVVVRATYAGVTRNATLTVTPPSTQPGAALESVSLSPSTVQQGTTQTSATLFFTTLTPTGGAPVTLSSSNTALATVPASVTIPALSSTGAFPVAISSTRSGTATISATYLGVTRQAVLTVTTQSLFRIITESPLPNARVGANYAGFIEACCGQGTPYRWSLVSGTVPDGLRFAGDSLRLSRTTGVTGVATRVQTTTFTVRARDGAGNTATRTFTLTVDPADPLIVNNGTDRLTDGKVGVAYNNGLFPLGGTPPWRWSHVGGTLPPGLAVQASPGRVLGTPTTPGSFTFTVRVDDSAGQFATQQFTILINP